MDKMGPTVRTTGTIDVDKVHLMSESESKMHKPFKLRKTFGKYLTLNSHSPNSWVFKLVFSLASCLFVLQAKDSPKLMELELNFQLKSL